MNFSEALKHIDKCRQAWAVIKSQFEGKERQILEQAYLVVDYHYGQINLSGLDPEEIALKHAGLFVRTGYNLDFIKLASKKAWLIGQIEKFQRIFRWTKNQLENTSADTLQLNAFTVEVRFRQLNFDLIQKLKQLDFVDKEKTDMSRVSIRITLKGNSDRSEPSNNDK